VSSEQRRIVSFIVTGKPEPKGSTRMLPRGGVRGARPLITSDNPKLKAWQRTVRVDAQLQRVPLFTGPVAVRLAFRLARPISLPRRITLPYRKPDVDKLTRAVLDALTGVLVRDDANVVELHATKRYIAPVEHPGVEITVADAGELIV
jgi:crossover junction endodeoxyribonuclease RusA